MDDLKSRLIYHAENYLNSKNFHKKTKSLLIKVIKYRFDGFSYLSISKHFKITRSRISTFERSFLSTLEDGIKKEYILNVKSAKKVRRFESSLIK